MYRAQMLAEYALYDDDPDLFNTELESYLRVTAEEIRDAAARYLATDNFALLEVVPAHEEADADTPSSSAVATGADQPGAPPPQVPPRPPAQAPSPTGTSPTTPLTHDEPHPEKPAQPSDAPQMK
jgi:hypothetical protein